MSDAIPASILSRTFIDLKCIEKKYTGRPKRPNPIMDTSIGFLEKM